MTDSSRKASTPKNKKSGKTTPESSTPKKLYNQILFHDWCKACGICMAFCPVGIIAKDAHGKPVITDADKCIGCRFCEMHCPDFAITIEERHPMRRKTNGVK